MLDQDLQSTPTESVSPQWAISYVQASKYLKQAELNLESLRENWAVSSNPHYWTEDQKERLKAYFKAAIRSSLLALNEVQRCPALKRSERRIEQAEKIITHSVDSLSGMVSEIFLKPGQLEAEQKRQLKALEEAQEQRRRAQEEELERQRKAREEALERQKRAQEVMQELQRKERLEALWNKARDAAQERQKESNDEPITTKNEEPVKDMPFPELRAKMKEAKLSFKVLARNTGVNTNAMSKKMRGVQPWRLWEKEAILDYLGIDKSETDFYFPSSDDGKLPTDEQVYLHHKLRDYLLDHGITHTDLAQELGRSHYFFSSRMIGEQPWYPGDPEMILINLGIDQSEKDKYFPRRNR